MAEEPLRPTNPLVSPLLNDLYQLNMAYAYWRAGRQDDPAVFDLFFRRCPFQGEFALFAGLEEALRLLSSFRFDDEQIAYLRTILPHADPAFFDWAATMDCSKVRVSAMREGTMVFPREPLLRVEGPLAITQLLETPLLNLVNYATLVATNAARFRLAAGPDKTLLEFGLRRAQGPDGGVSASRYCYMAGWDATSNTLAGQLFDIPVAGTMAHSFISSFGGFEDLKDHTITGPDGTVHDFVELVLRCREELEFTATSDGELAAFVAFAQAFPNGFLALVDTYNTLNSGIPNFIVLAVVLTRLGFKPLGLRLDSGDLAYLSSRAREMLSDARPRTSVDLSRLKIAASNDINEDTLLALNQQSHEIDLYGIGTHLVTCQKQPALGGVYKLAEVRSEPCTKLSEIAERRALPGRKEVYRLILSSGLPFVDLMTRVEDDPPEAGKPVVCRDLFNELHRTEVTPAQVIRLHHLVWDGGLTDYGLPSLQETRAHVFRELRSMRSDHLRSLNPTPYKVSVSEQLYDFAHSLWLQQTPIARVR
ncbi:MAG TPA: nicotinate phosphoribosyltransferase [Armatimonadota bacterium]